jgi:hypothetical protein
MAAPDSTKFQINYKLSDGTLINLYATTVTELETGLADLGMVASLIKSTGADLGGSATASAIANLQSAGLNPVSTETYASGPAASGGVLTAQGGKQCRHGAMAFKSGTSAKGPWQGWMCAAPKGAPDKCDTIWVR